MRTEQRQTPDLVAMHARIEDLAKRDSLSARELKEFVFLIYDKVQYDEGETTVVYDQQMFLPSREAPKIIMSVSGPKYLRGIYITLAEEVNTENPNRPTGEMIVLEDAVRVEWRVGIHDSAPSDFLGRRIAFDTFNLSGGGILFARDPLTNEEHARVAKTIHQPYLDSLNQSPQPVA